MPTITELNFLIVDDLPTMRRIVKGLLDEMDCRNTAEAADGAAALAVLRAQKIDFVVSAIEMPVMNGFELLRAIKADAALRHLPVLMAATRARKEDIVLAAQAGAAGYIVKPLTRASLEDKVRKIVQKLALAGSPCSIPYAASA